MKKALFIRELSERLARLSEEERTRFLNYCSEMIDDRMENGMSEEEAVAAIGSVDELAREMLKEFSAEKTFASTEEIGLKVLRFEESISSIHIQVRDICMTVRHSELPAGVTACVEMEPATEDFVQCEVVDGTMIIRQIGNENGSPLGFLNRLLHFGNAARRCTVTLAKSKLQSGAVESGAGSCKIQSLAFEYGLSVRVGSGAVKAQDVRARNLNVRASSGSLKLSDVNAESVEVRASSGSVNISNLICSEAVLEVSSGAVKLKGIRSDTLKLSASSGAVKISETLVKEMLDASASSGVFRLDGVEAGRMSLRTGSGAISGTLAGDPQAYSFYVEKRSGFVNVPNTRGPRVVEVHTGSGCISLSVEK